MTFTVQHQGRNEDPSGAVMHSWYVFPNPNVTARPEPAVRFYEMRLGVKSRVWRCSCDRELDQSPNGVICVHANAVFSAIIRKGGPWEQDKDLMEMAWEIVRRKDVEEEKPLKVSVEKAGSNNAGIREYRVRSDFRNGGRIDEVRLYVDDRRYRCSCGKRECEHIDAVKKMRQKTYKVRPLERTSIQLIDYMVYVEDNTSFEEYKVSKRSDVRPESFMCRVCNTDQCEHVDAVREWGAGKGAAGGLVSEKRTVLSEYETARDLFMGLTSSFAEVSISTNKFGDAMKDTIEAFENLKEPQKETDKGNSKTPITWEYVGADWGRLAISNPRIKTMSNELIETIVEINPNVPKRYDVIDIYSLDQKSHHQVDLLGPGEFVCLCPDFEPAKTCRHVAAVQKFILVNKPRSRFSEIDL